MDAILSIIGNVAGFLGLIVVICATCHKFLGVKRSKGARGGLSHGGCDECIEEQYGSYMR